MADLAAGSPTLENVEIVLIPPGGDPLRLSAISESLRWTTVASPGFGSLSCTLPGWLTKRDLPYLSVVRVVFGQRILWEGRLEDVDRETENLTTTIQAFGLHRILDEVGIDRTWVNRDLKWVLDTTTTAAQQYFEMQAGQYDDGDLTKIGVRGRGRGHTLAQSAAYAYVYLINEITRIKFTYLHQNNNNYQGFYLWADANGAALSGTVALGDADFPVDYDLPAPAGAKFFFFFYGLFDTAGTCAITDSAEIYDIRLIGPGVGQEDAPGGVYGDTVLRDVIDLVPGLQVGTIDDGSSFLIEHIDRTTPSMALSVVEEVAALYTKEWAVWEDGRFDWTDPHLDEPTWIIPSSYFKPLRLRESVDRLVRRTRVLYQDPSIDALLGFQQTLDQAAEATDQRNPFVRTGQTKDEIISAGFPMTARSASALAQKLSDLNGSYPPVSGSGVLPLSRFVQHAQLGLRPAWTIRAGDNVLIADLPVSEPFRQGRDGETLFHIVSTDVNADEGSVTLELDGKVLRIDTMMAQLGAVTRAVTG